MHPSQTRETAFNKDEGKHGQREILESLDIRQVPTKRRVEVQSQKSRFADKRRVYMSCTTGTEASHQGQRGRGPREARRPTGTEATSPGDAAGAVVRRSRAAGGAGAFVPVLADRAADGVDSSSLQFLTASALEARREEED